MAVNKNPDGNTGKENPEIKKSVDEVLGDSPSARKKSESKKPPKIHGNPGLSSKQNDQSKNKFGEAQVIKPADGKDGLIEARKLTPKADDPSTAAADPGKILAAAVMMVDPLMKAQILKNLIKQLVKVNATMNANSPKAAKTTVSNALYGALCILSNRYSLETVLKAFSTCFTNNGILLLTPDHQEIVKESLARLIHTSIENQAGILPTTVIPAIAAAAVDAVRPTPFVSVAPNLYIQQYYSIDTDPYSGYIQWLGPNGDYVYTLRNEPSFASAEEHVYSITEQILAKELEPYIYRNNLFPPILDFLLNVAIQTTQNNSMNKVLGNNAAANLMNLLPQLLGPLGAVLNLTLGSQLPTSVLNAGAVVASMSLYSKNMAMIKKMKLDSATAVMLPSGLQGLMGGFGGLGALSNLAGGGLGGIAGSLGGISSLTNIAGSLGGISSLTNIAGNLGAVAGNVTGNLINNTISSISGSLPNTGDLQKNASDVLKNIIS